MKSKQLKDWTIEELHDHCFAVQYFYMYLDPRTDKEEMYTLRLIYKKMCDWINGPNKKMGYQVNPGWLDWYDEHKRGR